MYFDYEVLSSRCTKTNMSHTFSVVGQYGALALNMVNGDRDCKADHGERTNRKLKDQPFYARGKNGKMRKW